MIEIWQADVEGHYAHPSDRWPMATGGFTGFGRATTDVLGAFAFETSKPGRVRGPGDRLQAPHASLTIVARGLLGHLYTRVYFGDEPASNAEDPVLSAVAAERRKTLIAARGTREGVPAYHFDIVLSGPDETVFFDV